MTSHRYGTSRAAILLEEVLDKPENAQARLRVGKQLTMLCEFCNELKRSGITRHEHVLKLYLNDAVRLAHETGCFSDEVKRFVKNVMHVYYRSTLRAMK